MPSESWRQHASGLLLQFPEGMLSGSQQLLATLQAVELEPVLQTSPGFEHELAAEHLPNLSVELTFEQRRPAGSRNPQQS